MKYKEIQKDLMKEFSHENKMAACRPEKVVVNTGFGKKIAKMNGKKRDEFLQLIEEDLATITGQKPVLTKARNSISGFTLRQGEVIGAKVTLRRGRMYDFMSRLVNVALPRSRDFQGIDRKAVDSYGNLTIGIKDQTIFPGTDSEGLKDEFSFQVTIKTTGRDRDEALRMFELLGFPLKKDGN